MAPAEKPSRLWYRTSIRGGTITVVGCAARIRWPVITPPLGWPLGKLPSVTTTLKSQLPSVEAADRVNTVVSEVGAENEPGQGVDQAKVSASPSASVASTARFVVPPGAICAGSAVMAPITG